MLIASCQLLLGYLIIEREEWFTDVVLTYFGSYSIKIVIKFALTTLKNCIPLEKANALK